MASAKVRVFDQRVVGMACNVVVAGRKVDVVHVERIAVDVDCIGVVRTGGILLAVAGGRRVEHGHVRKLAVVAVQLQDVVRTVLVGSVREQPTRHLLKVYHVRPPDVAVSRSADGDGRSDPQTSWDQDTSGYVSIRQQMSACTNGPGSTRRLCGRTFG